MTTISLRPVREGLFEGDVFHEGEVVALAASRCGACGSVAFPARARCEACGASTEPIALSTRATLVVATEVIHPPPDAEIPVPYGVGLVEFPEGISILGVLDEDLRLRPEVGVEVECFVLEFTTGEMTYGFRRPSG